MVLPYIDMNPPRVHMCSPSWGPAPSLWVSPVHRHCSVCQLTDLSSESSNLLTHLLYFSCQLLYSSIIISSFLYLLPVCGVLTLFFHASPDTSKYLLFVYLMGPLGLAVSLAFSSCGEWGLLSRCVEWASHCGGFSCGAQTLDVWTSIVVACGSLLPYGMWNLSRSGIETVSLALAGKFLTTGSPCSISSDPHYYF